jgi:hypothetical protein
VAQSEKKRLKKGSKVDSDYLVKLRANELPEIAKGASETGKNHPTFAEEKEQLKNRLKRIETEMSKMVGGKIKRVFVERYELLRKSFSFFEFSENPYQLESGLHLAIELTTAKKKRQTFEQMARVLSDFLPAVSDEGFHVEILREARPSAGIEKNLEAEVPSSLSDSAGSVSRLKKRKRSRLLRRKNLSRRGVAPTEPPEEKPFQLDEL